MSGFGIREFQDDAMSLDAYSTLSQSAEGETSCAKFWNRYSNCLRESQELDVIYDCRSRALDFQECTNRNKQSIWVFRESVVTMRKKTEFKKWLDDYDEAFGHPPMLEAVDKVRKSLQAEGGPDALHPTHFKDPVLW
jgi:hypothetical protein